MASEHERISIHSWQHVSMLDARRSSSVAHDMRSVTAVRASATTFDCAGVTAAAGCLGCGSVHSRGDWHRSCKWTMWLVVGVKTSRDWRVGRTSPSDAPPSCRIWDSRARHLAAEELTAKRHEHSLIFTYYKSQCGKCQTCKRDWLSVKGRPPTNRTH